jgi:sec-independent protein translocase protein TatA
MKWLLLVALLLLVLGAARLPHVGRSLGKALRAFREETSGSQDKSP